MKILYIIIIGLATFTHCRAENRELLMSMDDRFVVCDTAKWSVSVEKYMDLRLADVAVQPKGNKTFDLMLYFKCDTKDLAQFDTPEKMKRSVYASSKQYLGGVVEKEIVVEEIQNRGWYGFKTKFTDSSLVGKKPIPDGEFLYMIRGMIRLSDDSALGFSLMTNDLASEETRELEKYVYSFAKEKKT